MNDDWPGTPVDTSASTDQWPGTPVVPAPAPAPPSGAATEQPSLAGRIASNLPFTGTPLPPKATYDLGKSIYEHGKEALGELWEHKKQRAAEAQKSPGNVLTDWAALPGEVGRAAVKTAEPVLGPMQEATHIAAAPIAAGMAEVLAAPAQLGIAEKRPEREFSNIYGNISPEVEQALGLAKPAKMPWLGRAETVPPKLTIPMRPQPGALPPLSEGQATGDMAKLQLEHGARNNLYGPETANRAAQFDAEQQAWMQDIKDAAPDPLDTSETLAGHVKNTALDQAKGEGARAAELAMEHEKLRANLGYDGRIIARNPNEAADVIGASVTRAEEEARAARDAAYEQHEQSKGLYEPKVFANIGKDVRKELQKDAFVLDSKRTPISIAAVRDLDTTIGADARQGLDPAAKSFPALTPQKVEQIRKRLVSFRRQAESSARATGDFSDVSGLSRIQNAFDDTVTKALRNKKLFSGDGAAVADAIENARALHSDLRKTFSRQGAGDDAGALMQKIVGRGNISAPSVEIRSGLYGNGPKQVKVSRRLMDMFGENSPEGAALKQGFLSHLTENPEGMTPLKPEKVVDNINEALNGKGREVAQNYLNPNDQARLRAYADRLRASTQPPPGPGDIVSGEIDKIVAGAKPEEINRTLYGSKGDGASPKGVKLAEHIEKTYGRNSEPFEAIRRGQTAHLVNDEPAKVANKVSEYLDGNGRSMSQLLHSPVEREALRAWGEFNEKLKVVKGSAPHSGTPQFVNPILGLVKNQIARLIGGWIGGHIVPVVGHVMGYEGVALWQATRGNAAKLRMITKQMPLMSESIAKWEKAVQQVQRHNAPASQAMLAAATANLGRTITQLHPGLTLRQLVARAQQEQQNQTNPPPQRKAGGSVKKKADPERRAHGGIVGYADGGGDSDDPTPTVEDVYGIGATNVAPEAKSEAVGRAVNAVAQSYLSQPSWVEQAAKAREGEDPHKLRPSDERINLAMGMVGPEALTTEEAAVRGIAARKPHLAPEVVERPNSVAGEVSTAEPTVAPEAPIEPTPAARAAGPHPGLIDQRFRTAKKSDLSGTFGDERTIVDTDALRETPDLFEKNVSLVKDYPNMRDRQVAGAPADQVAKAFKDHVRDNLLWLYDQIPKEVRDRSSKWYEGGNKIVKDFAARYNVPEETAAGVIAATSPQKDWYQNVSFADRILDTLKGPDNHGAKIATPEMAKEFRNSEMNKPEFRPMWKFISDKSLNDIDKLPIPDDQKPLYKAMWVRMHDQAHRDPGFRTVTPEGEFGDFAKKNNGENDSIGWGSLKEIGKAIRAIEANGDQAKLNGLMGYTHKVRNFYNNLLDPSSAKDVTIDTHAVAAGLLRPFSSKAPEVAHNFANYIGKEIPTAGDSSITGVSGLYPLYADAYREAAEARGTLPRKMQSVTWEGVRGLFPEYWKGPQNSAIIDNIWRQYKSGKVGLDETRKRVLDAATKGRTDRWFEPDWFRSSAGDNEAARGAVNAAPLSERDVHGPAAEGATGGAGTGRAAALPEEEGLTWRNPLDAWRNYDWGQEPETGRAIRNGGLEKGSGASEAALQDDARRAAERAAAGRPKLIGLPDEPLKMDAGYYVPGPNAQLHDLAESYMRDKGIPYNPPKTYAAVDKERAARIADEFDKMKHDPSDPRVRASYDAMIDETLAQYRALKDAGIKFEMIKPDMPNPYELTPRLAAKDVQENKHLWFYPTSSGFGSDEAALAMIKDNPLLRPTGEFIDGKELQANDVFRIVHDIFGHLKDGNGFRAAGEENAWRSHSAMYSDLARPAMTSETRGQNSWLNYGPHGEKNRTAKSADTTYADQKIGLLPDWAIEQGRDDARNLENEARMWEGQFRDDEIGGGKASDYDWQETAVPVKDVAKSVFGSVKGTNKWMKDEIKMWKEDGDPHRFDDMLSSDIKEPIVGVRHKGRYYLWDGHHRLGAASLKNDSHVPIVLGEKKVNRASGGRLNYDDGGSIPHESDPYTAAEPPADYLDPYGKAITDKATNVMEAAALPGDLSEGVSIEPEKQGEWSDVDEARVQASQKSIGQRVGNLIRMMTTRRADGGDVQLDTPGPFTEEGYKYDDTPTPEQMDRTADQGGPSKNTLKNLEIQMELQQGRPWARTIQPHPMRARGGRVEPSNINPNPTPAQSESGNYAKDHVHIHGLPLTIENAKGSVRRGVGKNGPWESKLPSHYGYIKGTVGKDKDHIDVYVGPHTKSPHVFVVDQVDADSKKFDEHKIMLGFGSRAQAIDCYRKAFSDGKGHDRVGRVHELTVPVLRQWLDTGDTTKPFVHPDRQKFTKTEVDYRAGNIKKHCGICTMFVKPNGCTAVDGRIAASALCDLFKPK